MQSYLKDHHAGAFGPEDVKLLVAAFEDAWTQVPAEHLP